MEDVRTAPSDQQMEYSDHEDRKTIELLEPPEYASDDLQPLVINTPSSPVWKKTVVSKDAFVKPARAEIKSTNAEKLLPSVKSKEEDLLRAVDVVIVVLPHLCIPLLIVGFRVPME